MIFVAIGIFWIKGLSFNEMSVIHVMKYKWYLLTFTVLLFQTQSEGIHLLKNSDLTLKSGTLRNTKIYYHIFKWINKL